MEREAFFVYKTFSKLLLEARVGASQEEAGPCQAQSRSHKCLLNTSPLIRSKAQPGWFHIPSPPLTMSLGKSLFFPQFPDTYLIGFCKD